MTHWFAVSPTLYWTLAWTSFSVLLVVALAPIAGAIVSPAAEARMLQRFPGWIFALAGVLCFIAFRWPTWFVPEEFNPDESQIIAEAITLSHKPLFWGATDGGSHGPLDVYPLVLLHGLGLKLDYLTARVFGTFLVLVVLGSCYRVFTVFSRESLARAAILPIFCVFGFSSFWDWVHYSSEHVAIALLTLGFWLMASDLGRGHSRRSLSPRWLSAGLALGAVPMAKLQGAPTALLLLATGFLCDLLAGSVPWRARRLRAGTLVIAATAPTLFFAAITWIFGAWGYAWNAYIVDNLHYANGGFPFWQMVSRFWFFMDGCETGTSYTAGILLVAGLLAYAPTIAPRRGLRLVGWAAIFFAGSFHAALAPGRIYNHYLLFFLAPAGILSGAIWITAWHGGELVSPRRRISIILLLLLIGAGIVPQVVDRTGKPHRYLAQLTSHLAPEDNPVAKEILRYAKPGEPLGMWGWMCRYYVYTGMWQATRHGNSYAETLPTPLQNYFRWRYLHDLQRTRPPVFIDAVGPGNFWFTDRRDAHESYPELRDFITKEYRQVADINSCRIYVRLDRLR